jgi:uncharacterized phage protein gp47/JayE
VASQADITSQIVAALAVSEPDLDTSVGSVTRKIIDAVAASISGASVDSQMLAYQYDINSMMGAALDNFVQLFGMSRYPATRATGTVTFSRTTGTDTVSVPINTQVASADGSTVVQTLVAGVLSSSALSVTLPVQSVLAGPQGNVPAGQLTNLLAPVSEITAVTNINALSGGANQETDTQLQARWKATVFKNMAGTSQMFLGIALNDPDCTAANVVDSATRRREQLQIAGGQAVSTVSDAQYIYPAGQVAGRDIDNGDVAAPGVQYTWDYTANPPEVQVIDHSYFPEGQLIELSFLYMDDASRNNPAQGIYTRVDVWCQGSRAVQAASTIPFSTAVPFSASPASTWYAGSFINPDGTPPSVGNYFLALPYGPILALPATIVVGGTTFGLATAANPMGTVKGGITYAYQIVHRTGANGWSPYSDFGLEWNAGTLPIGFSGGPPIVVSSGYTYNDVPLAIQQQFESWRLAGTDVQAHQGIQAELRFSLAVVYDTSITISVTQQAISDALSSYLSQLGFNSLLYPSSVIKVVENVPGVIASRFLVGADYSSYHPAVPNDFHVGIQQIFNGAAVKSYVDTGGNPTNIEFGDDTVPVFGDTQLVTKAANTIGVFF